MMIPTDEFAKVLGVLATLYPRFVLEEHTIAAYYAILGDLDLDLLKAATLQCGAQNVFFPTAAELRAAAFELVERETGVPGASEAWGLVVAEVRRVGAMGAPHWDTPLIGRAVEAIGGWWLICMSENPTADRARFIQAYDALLERARHEERMLPRVRELVSEVAARLTASTAPALMAGAYNERGR